MKKRDVIRLLLTGALLYYVWRGDMWAIKLCITLFAVSNEFIVALVKQRGDHG